MCELFLKMTDQIQVLLAVTFVAGVLLEYFPTWGELPVVKKGLMDALIGLVLPVLGFSIGALQTCWPFTFEAATPFIIAAGWAFLAAIGGNVATKGTRAVGNAYNNRG